MILSIQAINSVLSIFIIVIFMIADDVKLEKRNHIKSLLLRSNEEVFIKYKEKIRREKNSVTL